VDHPSEEALKRFASGRASRREGKTVVVHLLKGCAGCGRKLSLLIEPPPVAAGAYDAALARFDRGLPAALKIRPALTSRNLLSEI
jgi:hypothetical protein